MKRSAEGIFSPVPPPPLPYPAALMVRALTPIVYAARLERIELAVASRIASVITVIEGLTDPHNAGAILRTCDGLGVAEVHTVEGDLSTCLTTRVTKGCEKWMNLRRHSNPVRCANELHARGFELFVADMRATTSIEEIAARPKIALAFGNEHSGVSAALRERSDGAFSVPMRGMVESFNVSVAAAISLYQVTASRHGDLGSDDAMELKARFLMESVREPELILARYVRDNGPGA